MSPRATGGQIAPASAMAIGDMAVEPDDDVERAARSIGEQDQAGRDRPADDEGDGDEAQFEPADPHRRESTERARAACGPGAASASTAEDGTAGSSRGSCGRPSNMPLPHRTRATGRGQRTEDTWVMAGQAPRGSRGRGRSSRPDSSLPRGHGGHRARAWSRGHNGDRDPAPRQVPEPPTPATRAVYRLLLMKGLSPTEAASLTAFICGLPTTDLHWSLKQVNQLLFLRRMRQLGRFGDGDGRARRPD